MEPKRQSTVSSIGLLILRLGIGGYMLTHGWGKLRMLIAGDLDAIGDPIGLGGGLSLVLIVFAEFVCPLLVMVGLATRFAAMPTVIGMAVAAFVVHGSDPWTLDQAARLFMAGETDFPLSKESALLYLVPFLTLVFTGPGGCSIDALIRPRRGTVGNGLFTSSGQATEAAAKA